MRKILKNNFDKIVFQNLGEKCFFQGVSYQVIANTQKNVTKIKKKSEKKCYTFVKPKKNLIFVGDCLTNENY